MLFENKKFGGEKVKNKKENTELPKEQNNTNIKENMENKNIMENTENTELEKQYMEIQKKILDKTKKGDFQGIVDLLKSDIIQKYTEYQKQKEEEKKQKLQQIEEQIQEKIKEIDILKQEIRDLKNEKKQIQGYNMNMDNTKTRIINRISHEYQYNMNKTNKAIDIIYMVLSEYGITKEAWDNFNHDHSISWNYFIEQVKQGKYPQKENLKGLFNNNMDNLNTFYQKVKEITIS